MRPFDQPAAETTGDPTGRTPDGELMSPRWGRSRSTTARLDDVTLAFQRWGTLSPARDNVVLTLHALTGDSHVTGPADENHPTRAGGRADRSRLRRRHRPMVRRLGQCPRWLPRVHRTVIDRTGRPALGIADSRGSRSVTRCIRTGPLMDARSASARWRRSSAVRWVVRGRWNGCRTRRPDPVRAGAGRRSARHRRSDRHPVHQITAIKADPDWQGGDYYGTGRAPPPVWVSPGGWRTCPTVPRSNSMTGSATTHRVRRIRENSPTADTPSKATRKISRPNWAGDSTRQLRRTHRFCQHPRRRPGRGGVEAALRGCTVPVVVGGSTRPALPTAPAGGDRREPGNAVGGLHVVRSDKGHDGFLPRPTPSGDPARYYDRDRPRAAGDSRR